MRLLTRASGVSLRIVSLLLWTNSGLPERQTFVTCPLTRFGSDDLTVASIGSPLLEISLQSFLKASTLCACIGSSYIGTSSAASSGCVHLAMASVVA